MRDIRVDLRERIEALSTQRAHIKTRLEQLSALELHLSALLQEEDARWVSQQPLLILPEVDEPKDKSALVHFLQMALDDGAPHSLEELKQLASDSALDFENKHPGRVLHFALLGMQQNGAVTMPEKGVWQLVRR